MGIALLNANAERIPLADGVVHAVVTSPPYYGLRKYALSEDDPEIGLEDTPELYLERMVVVFREVRRVLRDDGVCWVNMGDSYNANQGVGFKPDGGRNIAAPSGYKPPKIEGYKPLDLMNIPARLVIALQADGWYHRSTVIWYKPNPMPESVSGWYWERHRVKVKNSQHATEHNIKGGYEKMLEDASVHQGMSPDFLAQWQPCPGCEKCDPNDGLVLRRGSWRPTTAHEYIFMLAKTKDYWADGEAVREKVGELTRRAVTFRDDRYVNNETFDNSGSLDGKIKAIDGEPSETGRNARSVWEFPTQPYPGSHFATYPEELPRRCLKASISERGCCPECGSQWARVMNKSQPPMDVYTAGKLDGDKNNRGWKQAGQKLTDWRNENPTTTLGFRPTCQCKPHEPVSPIVLDPFCGSGTTGIVARELGAHFIGVDLSYSYLHEQARERLSLTALKAWEEGQGIADNTNGKKPKNVPEEQIALWQ